METVATKAPVRGLWSGDEAVALAALDGEIALGTGYPGTPSTEILEAFSRLGGRAQWAPNEKVALEVGLGAAFAGARVLVTMKHVGVNVAADPLFTAAYTGVDGALVLVSADDPGMASVQNEQDNRRYAVAAGVPMLEPADSQEAYDFTLAAFEISDRWKIPVILRMTTRVCHSKSVVRRRERPLPPRAAAPLRARHPRPRHDAGLRPSRPPQAPQEARGDRRPGPRPRPLNVAHGGEPGAGHHHLRHLLPARARGRPRGPHLQAGRDLPAPRRDDPPLRRGRGALRGDRGGRPVLAEALLAAGIRVRGQAGDVPLRRAQRGPGAPHPGRRRVARGASGEGQAARSSAQACPHRPVYGALQQAWTASWPATSAATRWASCRPSRRWTPAWPWAHRWASGWGFATCCPRSRPAGW